MLVVSARALTDGEQNPPIVCDRGLGWLLAAPASARVATRLYERPPFLGDLAEGRPLAAHDAHRALGLSLMAVPTER